MAISRFSTSSVAQGLPKYQKLWDGTSAVFDSDYELIERITVGSGGSLSVTFSSIPQTYRHLQIRTICRSDRAVTAEGAWFYPNNDTTTTNYARHVLEGDGSALSVSATVPTSGGTGTVYIPGSSTASNIFGVGVTDIFDYADTNKYKTMRTTTGLDVNGSGGVIRTVSGVWLSTASISSIKIDTQGGGNFVQYTSFALYGIKGAA